MKLGASRLSLGCEACVLQTQPWSRLPLQHPAQLLVPLGQFLCLGLPPMFIATVLFKSLRRCEPSDLLVKSLEDF